MPPTIVRSYRAWPFFYSYSGSAFAFYDPFYYSTFGFPGYAYGYSTAPFPFDSFGPTGGLRLKVKAREAIVYVDGYYAGIVDDFDGHFQHLDLTPGPHHVEIVAPGYAPLDFDVNIQPHRTTVYHGALQQSVP